MAEQIGICDMDKKKKRVCFIRGIILEIIFWSDLLRQNAFGIKLNNYRGKERERERERERGLKRIFNIFSI
jgi:hypothetical protein